MGIALLQPGMRPARFVIVGGEKGDAQRLRRAIRHGGDYSVLPSRRRAAKLPPAIVSGESAVMRNIVLAGLAAVVLLAVSPAGRAQDTQEGYYYPKPSVVETYQARVATLADSDRSRRLGFVTALSKEFDARPYPPNYLVYAKGDEADKLIITGMMDGQFNTIYRTRALLADLTASARLTDFFQKNAIAEYATFLDFLKLLGFKQVTVTDGHNFAQQIKIE